MSDPRTYTKVNFQDAMPFYKDMYDLKLECIRSGEATNPSDVKTVMAYYKKIHNLFFYVSAYIDDNDGKYHKRITTEIKETIADEILKSGLNEKNNNIQGKREQKERLRDLINDLEEIELFIYKSIKSANLELPLTKKNPYQAMMQSELF